MRLVVATLLAIPMAAAAQEDATEEPPSHHETPSLPVSDQGANEAKSEPKGIFDKRGPGLRRWDLGGHKL